MIPVSFYCEWEELGGESARRQMLAEFAAAGAKHLVLTDGLLGMISGDPKLYRQLPQELSDAGLTFADAHLPYRGYCDLWVPIPERRPQLLARMKFLLQLIADYGITTCTMHTGNRVYYPQYTLEQHRDAVRASLDELLPLAEKLDITLGLENLFKPLSDLKTIIELNEEFRSDHLGACFDSGHANVMERGMGHPDCVAISRWTAFDMKIKWEENILERMLPYIVNCHLHDNSAATDAHDLPGRGTVDWRNVVAQLRAAPRLQCIQSEVKPLRNRIAIPTLVGTFKDLLKDFA